MGQGIGSIPQIYLKVGETFVPISQYSEAIKEMTDKFDCINV